MDQDLVRDTLDSLGNALDRFGEALDLPDPDPIVMDGTIQRFEFTFELFWKTLRRFLALEGVDTASPKNTLRHAYRRGLLQQETIWINMLKDRNLSAHVYDEPMARALYQRLPTYYNELRKTYLDLQHRAAEL